MPARPISARPPAGNPLGCYLKDRRAQLDPAAFGFPPGRRRTPGLRREEVAARANISPTWYTWLEQGRGGAPSADVLDRLSRALMLTDAEREHLFLIGLGRPPERHLRQQEAGVSPRLQRVLDAMVPAAAMIRTLAWDVVAWNRTAPVLLGDYGSIPPEDRNILVQLFCNPAVRSRFPDWTAATRFIVGAFRADVARAGSAEEVERRVADLCRRSPEFEALWRGTEIASLGGGLKTMLHPVLGEVEIEYSSFSVDGRPDLAMVVYNPTDPEDAARILAQAAAP